MKKSLKKIGHLICLLLASLGLSLTSCSKKNYSWSTEEEYYQLPIWKNHVRVYKKMKYPQPNSKVFIGDSMTEGFDLKRHFPDAELINMGIGGDFTSGVLMRLKYATRLQPKSVFIMIGINDILKNIEMEKIQSRYKEILETLKAELPQSTIFVQSNLPTSGMGGSEESNKITLQQIAVLNAFLSSTCDLLGIQFINMYDQFTTPNGVLRKDLTYDGLHLSEEGYLVWKKNIEHLI